MDGRDLLRLPMKSVVPFMQDQEAANNRQAINGDRPSEFHARPEL